MLLLKKAGAEFERCIVCGYLPDESVKLAFDYAAKEREKRSLLAKVIAGAMKGGFRLIMPNGVECTIERDGDSMGYWLDFNVANEVIAVHYYSWRPYLFHVINNLEKGIVTRGPSCIDVVLYRGKVYRPSDSTAEVLFKSIEENMKPNIMAVVF